MRIVRKANGFTLIELLVVSALAVIIILGASSLLFTSLVSNTRQNVITTIKQEGDFALGQMEFLLRNAVELVENPSAPGTPKCSASMNSISFESRDRGVTTLSISGNKIASSSAAGTTYLTSDAVDLSPTGTLFSCQTATNAGSYVTINFVLTLLNDDFRASNPVTETFTTSVNVRSF